MYVEIKADNVFTIVKYVFSNFYQNWPKYKQK